MNDLTPAKPFRIDDLHDYLTTHKNDIDYVCLEWFVTDNTIHLPTRNYVIRDGIKRPMYARFRYTKYDLEYSFIGSIDQAIDYAAQYPQWDGHDGFIMEGGILHCRHEEWNPNGDEYHGGEDDFYTRPDVRRMTYTGLIYYTDGGHHFYDGPVVRGGWDD